MESKRNQICPHDPTAYTQDNTKSPLRDAATGGFSDPWAYGSVHVDPHKAISPGLVYDLTSEDYVRFLCSLDYNIPHIQTIVKHPNVTCSKKFADASSVNEIKDTPVAYVEELHEIAHEIHQLMKFHEWIPLMKLRSGC